MPNPTFRPYAAADQPRCLELFDANCPEFFAPNERGDYAAFLAADPAGYQLCLVDDRIAGAFGVFPDGPEAACLSWILLAPEAQGRGLGSVFMDHTLERARALGVRRLHIAASHRSAPFFARFGAVELRTTPHGWGPEMHRIDMELPVTATPASPGSEHGGDG